LFLVLSYHALLHTTTSYFTTLPWSPFTHTRPYPPPSHPSFGPGPRIHSTKNPVVAYKPIGTHICINLQPSFTSAFGPASVVRRVLLSKQDPTVRLHCGVNLLQQIDSLVGELLLFPSSLPCSLFAATPSSPPLGLSICRSLPLVPAPEPKEKKRATRCTILRYCSSFHSETRCIQAPIQTSPDSVAHTIPNEQSKHLIVGGLLLLLLLQHPLTDYKCLLALGFGPRSRLFFPRLGTYTRLSTGGDPLPFSAILL
jgi:hypothetical protein